MCFIPGLKSDETSRITEEDQELESVVWQVKSSNGDFEFCKMVCILGQWRGPVCKLEVADITGMARGVNEE